MGARVLHYVSRDSGMFVGVLVPFEYFGTIAYLSAGRRGLERAAVEPRLLSILMGPDTNPKILGPMLENLAPQFEFAMTALGSLEDELENPGIGPWFLESQALDPGTHD